MCRQGNGPARGAGGERLRSRVIAVAALSVLIAAVPVRAQPFDAVRFAPDITTPLDGVTVDGGRLATDDLSGDITLLDVANLPAGARIAAAHRFANGDLVLAFETTLALPGVGTVEPRDLVQYASAGGTYSLVLAGVDVDIPAGATIDALAITGTGTILLSLDVSLGTFDDEDVLAVDGGALELFLDLSAIGVADALDLDALDLETGDNGEMRLFASFDGTGTVDGVPFDDEDAVVYGLTSMSWALAYDASLAAAPWPAAADLIALDTELPPTPTPSATPTVTPVATETSTATETPTGQPTAAATGTATSTVPGATGTATATATPTEAEATRTATATATSAEATATATATPPGATGTVTGTATLTPTGPLPPTGTATATAVETATATATTPGATGTATVTATATVGLPCPGDCNGSGEVTIDELVRLVNIALGNQPVSNCLAGDLNSDGMIAINEIVTAVNAAINGCP